MLQITIFLSNYSNFIRKRKKKKTKSMVEDEYLNDIKHEGGRRGRGEDLRWGQPDKEWIGRDCFYAKASNGCHICMVSFKVAPAAWALFTFLDRI